MASPQRESGSELGDWKSGSLLAASHFLLNCLASGLLLLPGMFISLNMADAPVIARLLLRGGRVWTPVIPMVMTASLASALLAGNDISGSMLHMILHFVNISISVVVCRFALARRNPFEDPLLFVRILFLIALIPLGLGLLASQLPVLQGITSRPLMVILSETSAGTMLAMPCLMLLFQEGHRLLREINYRALAFRLPLVCLTAYLALSALPFSFIYPAVLMLVSATLLTLETIVALVLISSGAIAVMIPLTANTQGLLPPLRELYLLLPLMLMSLPPLTMAVSMRQSQSREKALQASRDDMQNMLDHMPAMIGYWDKHLVNRFSNRNYQDWFGLEHADIRGHHMAEVLGTERFNQNLPRIQAALQGVPQSFEQHFRDPAMAGGRTALTSYIPDISDGLIQGFYVFVSDVTALREARQREEEARHYLRSVIDAAVEVSIIATDTNGVITLFSSGAERMLGYRSEELVGRFTPAIIHHEEEIRARALTLSQECGTAIEGFETFVHRARTGKSDSGEWTYVRKDGSCLPVQLVVTAIMDQQGQINGFLGIATDITAQRNATKALLEAKEHAEQSSRAKSQFLANMSHEIRTPMNAVLGMAQLLAASPLSPTQTRHLDMISQSGKSLLSILNDILDLSKIEANKIELAPETFRLDELMSRLASFMTASLGAKPIKLAIGIDPDVPRQMIADAGRLLQILTNLTGNAIKFTDQGYVTLNLTMQPQQHEASPRYLAFDVEDTGPGISPELAEKLFTPFMQADGSMTRRYGGTGLGLVISRRLAQLMGGDIYLGSTPGKGSRFRACIQVSVAPNPPTPSRMTFLLAEKDPILQAYAERILRHEGHNVVGVSRVDDLMTTLAAWPKGNSLPHALLVCEEFTGSVHEGLLKQLDEDPALPKLPVILMTDHSKSLREQDIHATCLLPVSAVSRPLTASRIIECLNEISIPLAAHHDSSRLIGSPMDRLEGIYILLAEDNPHNQLVASGLLGHLGAVVDIAKNGLKALEMLRSHPDRYDIVLMDIQMPVMDGITACRTLREEGFSLPVLAVSAGVMETERESCLVSGMNGFVAKPIQVEYLAQAIHQALPDIRKEESHLENVVSRNPLPAASLPPSPALNGPPEQHGIQRLEELLRFSSGKQKPGLIKLILDLLETGPDTLLQIRRDWQANQPASEIQRRLHSFRGSFGIMADQETINLAQELESAIPHEDAAITSSLFELLQARIESLSSRAALWMDENRYLSPSEATEAITALEPATFNELLAALDHNELGAFDLYSQIRPALAGWFTVDELNQLDGLLEDLDFKSLLVRLERVKDY